ncbi:hypothetical protein WA026_020969 [Henosepilachna vigintioctopunctata]|uniref:Choline transporter-like protein n=1 Tax=Henosepilachna vigintioctopunctata TaxID=420089 RepID=A0AAW1VA79_9CUCU
MGLTFSQEDDVERLFQFRKLSTEDLEIEIPEKTENRRPTDRPWLYVFIAAFLILIPFLIYTLIYTEWRQLSGSDNCGNFCGYKNKKYDEWACTGKDYTEQKYEVKNGFIEVLGYRIQSTECVSRCPNDTKPKFGICLPTDSDSPNTDLISTLGEIGRAIAGGWWAILLSAVISCLFSFGALLLFRHAVNFVVWSILIGLIVALTVVSGFFWYEFMLDSKNSDHNSNDIRRSTSSNFLSLAIVFSVIVVFLVIVLACMVKRIKLIIALFEEASKALFEIPSLIVMPIYLSVLLTLMILGFTLLNFSMLMAGKLTEIAPNYLSYSMDNLMILAIIYNFFFFTWLVQFVLDCQFFVVGGAVATWFFTRNKQQLGAPVWTSFTNLRLFHLGTLALGSLILTVTALLRAIIKSMAQNPRTRWIINCCFDRIEHMIKILSNNAYIMSAIHGQSFLRSGKRACKLLISNAINLIAINSIGDLILATAMSFIILLSIGAGILLSMATEVENYSPVAVVCAIIAIIVTLVFFSSLKATIDCLFICFCEDTTLNDGMARPYFMSKSLMKFIEDSKVVMPKKP